MAKKTIKLFYHHNIYEELTIEEIRHSDFPRPLSFKHRLLKAGAFLLWGCMLSLVFYMTSSVNSLLELKREIELHSQIALSSLNNAQNAFADSQMEVAITEFNKASINFQTIQKKVYGLGIKTKIASIVYPKLSQAMSIVKAADKVSIIGAEASNFAKDYDSISFNLTGTSENQALANFLNQAPKKINEIKNQLKEVSDLLQDVNPENFPSSEQEKIRDFKNKVYSLQDFLNSSQDLLQIFRGFLQGDKQVLILFQNYREIRPTGGFMGTFGRVELKNGLIHSVKVSSIYDLDGQITKKFIPPEPIFALNERWYLRDSNWFANFPDSAKKASLFYERAGGNTPDFVIALTPELVTRLLKITGPIKLLAYNTELNSENFVETTQFLTSVAYDRELNTPKAMIADFLPLFLQKLSDLDTPDKLRMLNVLYQILEEKHLMFYARSPEIQKSLSRYRWTGEVEETQGDYLMVNVSNLNGTKVEQDITQNIQLRSQMDSKGEITNTLKIERINPLPDSKNNTSMVYMRVFTPLGSELIHAKGFNYQPFDSLTLKKEGEVDVDVEKIEKNSKLDFSSKTSITQESGKTVFGNWLEVKGGQTAAVELKYKIPQKYDKLSQYSILLQKQPGIKPGNLDYRFETSGNWKIFANAKDLGMVSTEFTQKAFKQDVWHGWLINK